MNIDIELIKEVASARWFVGKWLNERPNAGLDVTDVATLCVGIDYLVKVIKDITGEDITVGQLGNTSNMEVTFLELDE